MRRTKIKKSLTGGDDGGAAVEASVVTGSTAERMEPGLKYLNVIVSSQRERINLDPGSSAERMEPEKRTELCKLHPERTLSLSKWKSKEEAKQSAPDNSKLIFRKIANLGDD